MVRTRDAELVANAHRLVALAKAKKVKPARSRAKVKREIERRQRGVRASILRRRDPATRLRMSRRAEIHTRLVAELRQVAAEGAKRRDPEGALRESLKATSAVRPEKPPRTEAERKLNQRRAPLRFIIDLGRERTVGDATKHLSKALGVELSTNAEKWPSIEPLLRRPKRHRHFVLTLPQSRGQGGGQRFVIAQAIKQRTKAASVQPSELVTLNAGIVDFVTPPPPVDTEWPLDTMRVPAAWDMTPAGSGRRLGAGETIGHLDTGWFDHPEYDQERIDLDRAYNAVTDSVSQTAASHSYEGGPNETHGLATGALMVSAAADADATQVSTVPKGPSEPGEDGLAITGVAPEASVLPVRCLDMVFVTVDNVDLVRGAEYLIEPEDPDSPAKVGVISMSLGGVPHYTLEDVLNVGVRDKGVIALAAAGQIYVGQLPVIAPAAYPEVIAVAASTPTDEPAYWTFAGAEVDIAAPGEAVWIADVRGEEATDGSIDVRRFVGYAHGTSFSCALTAGVAALWRAFYADELTSGAYDDVATARVFRQHLRETARRPDGWDTRSSARASSTSARCSRPRSPAPTRLHFRHR